MTIMMMLGGMIGPMAPPAAWSAVAKPAGYPRSFMAGIIMEPTAAVLALELPEMLAKNMDETTDTIGSPPRSRPTTSTVRREIPQAFMSSPAKMKSGTAISAQELSAAKARWGMSSKGIWPSTMSAAIPLRPIAKATGTPSRSRTASVTSRAAITARHLPGRIPSRIARRIARRIPRLIPRLPVPGFRKR